MKWRAVLTVLLWTGMAQAFFCPHPSRHILGIREVWSGAWSPPDANFVWCVNDNMVAGEPIYEELLKGRGFCFGRGCPVHSGRLLGSIMNMDQSVSPTSGVPHGVLKLSGTWRHGRCTLTGQTQPDPPLADDRVGGIINAQLTCHRGKVVFPVIYFVLTRTQ